MDLTTLRTTRLSLEPFRREDVDDLHALWTDSEVRRHLWDNEIITRERAVATVDAAIRAADAGGAGMWTVRESEAPNLIIGFCGLREVSDGEIELLYALWPRFWRRGLATEAASAVLQYGFVQLGARRIVAGADPINLRSFAVMERLGMKLVPGAIAAVAGAVYYQIEEAPLRS